MPLTFEELGPLLMQEEEACERVFNKFYDKALYAKDKSGKSKSLDSKKIHDA